MNLFQLATLVLLFVTFVSTANAAEKNASQPNLLLVMVDQMRYQAMGFVNEDPVVTPNLDRFAKESLVLTQMVVNVPICSPARAMFMTGQYPTLNKVPTNCTSNSAAFGCELQKETVCWSDVLKASGYSLGYIGKWHLEAPRAPYIDCANNRGATKWNDWTPPERRHGFDYWYAYNTYDHHMRPLYWDNDAKRNEFHYVDQWGPEHEVDKAIQFLKNKDGKFRKADQPFVLMVSMNPPHTPYGAHPKHYQKAYEGKKTEELINRKNVDLTTKGAKSGSIARNVTRDYFAMVTGVDDQFGRLLKALKQEGFEKDTVVLFFSDHGNCIGSHNIPTKSVAFEESMRIPFLIRWPKHIEPRQDDLLMSYTDIYPTLLGLLGLDKKIPATVDGLDYSRIFLDKDAKMERPTSQWYFLVSWRNEGYDHGKRGIRTHQYKLVLDDGILQGKKDAEMTVRLYDLKNDPYELKSIATQKPELVQKLINTELKPWLRKSKDPFLKTLEAWEKKERK